MPNAVVTPRPVDPPRVGLLASASPVDDERWDLGFSWVPESCADFGGTFDPCDFTDVFTTTNPTVDDPGAYKPFGIYAYEKCSTFSQAVDLEQRVTRALNVGQEKWIAAEFWTGAQATAAGWSNDFLRNSLTVNTLNGGAMTPAVRALADLEQHIADARGGGRGMIHATRRLVTYWQQLGLIRREGAMLLTVLDTIIVPGEGYDGSSPAGVAGSSGSSWAYATGMVEVRLGKVKIIGPDAPALTTQNQRIVIASRLAAVTFDDCIHAGIRVEHCNENENCLTVLGGS